MTLSPVLTKTSQYDAAEGSSLAMKKQQPASPSHSPVTSINEKEELSPPEFNPSTQFYLAFVTLTILTLMVALDGTSLSVALPIIAEKLHGSALEAFWAGTSFLLASTIFQPSFASFSHIFGRIPLVMIAITFFFIGVMVAALSKDFTLMLVGRTIQGVGGGGIIIMTEILITDLVPLRFRGQWAGFIGSAWAVGSVSGPIIGGAFAQKVSWRWIFWINLPFIAISYVMVPVFIRLHFVPSSLVSKLRRVDWTGSVLFVGSTTSFLIPITWGGVMYEWTSWRTLVPLIVGAVGLVIFTVYECYIPNEPLIRPSLFYSRTTNLGYLQSFVHGMVLWCMLYYQPLYFEAVKEYSPILSGVALFPATFTVAPVGIATGITITKTGRFRWSIWGGWAITTIGLGTLTLWKVDTHVAVWVVTELVTGIGLGTLVTSILFQVQAAAAPKDVAFAVAMFGFFRSFGQSVGVAIGGAIFQNQMLKNLQKLPQFVDSASELAKNAAALVQTIKHTSAGVDQLALKTAYTDSVRTIYIVLCALAGVVLLLSAFTQHHELNIGLETEQGLMVEKRKKSAEEDVGEGQA